MGVRVFARLVGGSAVTLLVLANPVEAAQNVVACDASIRPQAGADGYRERRNYCEGTFLKDVSAPAASLASLVEFEDIDAQGDMVRVAWAAIPGEVQLQGTSTRPGLAYRLDALVEGLKPPFSFSPDILRSRQVENGDVGWLAFGREEGAEDPRLVALPISAYVARARCGTPRAVLWLATRAIEIRVSLTRRSAEGPVILRSGVPLDQRRYASGSAVTIQLPELESAGYYELDIDVRLRNESVVRVSHLVRQVEPRARGCTPSEREEGVFRLFWNDTPECIAATDCYPQGAIYNNTSRPRRVTIDVPHRAEVGATPRCDARVSAVSVAEGIGGSEELQVSCTADSARIRTTVLLPPGLALYSVDVEWVLSRR